MKKLIELNSFLFLLLFIGVVAISFFTFKVWTLLAPGVHILFGISIILLGFLVGYFFWIYSIGYGLNNLFQKYGKNKGFRNFKLVLITACTTIFVSYIGNVIYLVDFGKQPPEFISLPLALISLYCLIHIIGHMTNDFKFLDKGTEPIFWDYIVTTFLLFFFPFGLLILHSHMRLLRKNRINEKKTNANTG